MYRARIAKQLVLSYFAPAELPRLLRAARTAGIPKATRVYVGSYGVGAELGAQIDAAGYRYAPMFQLRPGWYWERRRLPPKDAKTLLAASGRSARLAGPLPPLPQLLRLPSAARITWAVELGARFRDELRAGSDAGVPIASWQLDEIQAEAVGVQGQQYRELTRGALRGLLFGRPPLGDRPQQGFVWWANTAFVLATRPITPELAAFWRMLNRSSLALLGEEYPEFVGDPVATARVYASGQQGLRGGGPVRRALARKYLGGLTPGYRLVPGLGGNTHGLSRAGVNIWRGRYILARAAAGVAGFGEFNFRFENSRAWVMQDVLRQLAASL